MSQFQIEDLLNGAFQEHEGLNARELFDQKINEYGITKSKALELLGIDKDVFEEVLSGKAKQPNLIHVVKLAEFLDIGLQELVNAVLRDQNAENVASLDRARKATFLIKYFDLKRLETLGFLEKKADLNAIVSRLLSFFGYENISAFEEALEEPLYSKRAKRLFTDKMKKFWIDAAYRVFQNINNPNEYDREGVKDIIAKAKPFTTDVENGLLTVCRALYDCGVTVIAQGHLPTTQVRGGTFMVNNKPCIVLTDLGKRYPTVWTTLIHELHHVVFDLDVIEKTKIHLTDDGQADLLLIEDKANKFMMDYFCEEAQFQYIKPHIHNPIVVKRFAVQLQVHPSMIYNAYQFYQQKFYGEDYWRAFSTEIPKSTMALSKLNAVTWKETSITEIAKNLKEIFEINP